MVSVGGAVVVVGANVVVVVVVGGVAVVVVPASPLLPQAAATNARASTRPVIDRSRGGEFMVIFAPLMVETPGAVLWVPPNRQRSFSVPYAGRCQRDSAHSFIAKPQPVPTADDKQTCISRETNRQRKGRNAHSLSADSGDVPVVTVAGGPGRHLIEPITDLSLLT